MRFGRESGATLCTRGSATGGAPPRFRTFALAALVLAFAGEPAAAGRVRNAPAPAYEALAFAGLAWDAPAADVVRTLSARGFARAGGDDDAAPGWRGAVQGRTARVSPEYDAAGRLIAVTLRFEPDDRGSVLQRYTGLVGALRRRHGPWTVQVEPGRAVEEERFARARIVRRLGPRTAATLWTDAAGAAAAAQLDGAGVLWLRYESPRWEAAARERDAR